MHSASCSVSRITRAIARALLTTLRCVRVAPFGLPVVPLVNWILMGSVSARPAPSTSRPACSRSVRPCASTSSKRSMPAGGASLIDTTARSAGRRAACRAPGAQSSSSGASVRSIWVYCELLNESAATSILQPTRFSAYSSSASR